MPARNLYVQPVTDEVRAELERLRRQAVGRVAQRAHMVLLSLRGQTVAEIADTFGCGEDVVRTWLHRFDRRGERGVAAALDDLPRSGRPPKDPLAGHIIDAQAGQSPPCFGLLASCWTVALLAMHLATVFGLTLAPSTVRHYLHRWDWRWGRPKHTLANVQRDRRRRDPERPAKLARLARVRAWARAMPDLLHLVFVDETDLCLLPVLRHCWHKRGRQTEVPTPGFANPKRTVFAALDLVSGRWLSRIEVGRRSVHFEALLAQLEATFPTGLIVVALDSAPAHTAKRIQRWVAAHPRVRLLWLPKYSAHESNPVERIWGHLKSKVAANRYYGQIERLVAAAERFFHELTPEEFRRLAGVDDPPEFLQAA
jgi:transposase